MLEQKHSGAPMIRLLGEMKVVGARGTAPISASNGKVSQAQEARCVALAAFLSLHPGATAEQVHAAFWPNARPEGSAASSNRNKLATHTRRLLGQAEDGTVYFPAVTTTEGYRLDESVLTDWQVFQELVGADPVTASTPSLLAAMQLVRGEPFAHAKPRNIAWADELVQQMTQRICDAAHELVARSLASGNTEHARLAARGARRGPGQRGRLARCDARRGRRRPPRRGRPPGRGAPRLPRGLRGRAGAGGRDRRAHRAAQEPRLPCRILRPPPPLTRRRTRCPPRPYGAGSVPAGR